MKNLARKYNIYIGIGIIAMLGALVFITYALFFRTAVQNSTNLVSSLSCVEVDFISETPSINIDAAYPKTNQEGSNLSPYTFTVKNECNSYIEYQVVATVINQPNKVQDNYVKFKIDNQQPKLITQASETDASAHLPGINIHKSYSITGGTLSQNQEQTYDFRMWLDGENNSIWEDDSLKTKQYQIRLSIIAVVKIPTHICDKEPNNEYLQCEILKANGGRILTENKPEPNFNVISPPVSNPLEGGMWSTEDDHGISYYFRGSHEALNNNVIFAGFQWKIIRIDGNGNIRMIYNGDCPGDVCTINGNVAGPNANAIVNPPNGRTVAFNNLTNDNVYVGYVFGTPGSSTHALTHANLTDSTIKLVVDNWYINNIPNEEKIKLSEIYFCNDRTSFISQTEMSPGGGFGATATYYGAFVRLSSGTRTPTLRCLRLEDRFNLPVGLITLDESSLSGLVPGSNNWGNYLRSSSLYWTMSPARFSAGASVMYFIDGTGSTNNTIVNAGGFGIRPVIALRHDVELLSGDGSATNPYRIK